MAEYKIEHWNYKSAQQPQSLEEWEQTQIALADAYRMSVHERQSNKKSMNTPRALDIVFSTHPEIQRMYSKKHSR